jgi:hypothetical protein
MHLGAPATILRAPATSVTVPATSLREYATSLSSPMTCQGMSATSLGVSQITVEHCGKNNIFFGNTAGASGNRSFYLSFNDV